MKILKNIKNFLVERMFHRIIREIKYRRRIKELRKRDPFIY